MTIILGIFSKTINRSFSVDKFLYFENDHSTELPISRCVLKNIISFGNKSSIV